MPASPPTTWEAYARELGLRVQQARHDAGMTQEDLAHAAGMTRTHFQQIERGWWKRDQPSNPSLKRLVRLATTLGLPVDDLLPDASKLEWD